MPSLRNPFRSSGQHKSYSIKSSRPLLYDPGTNWNYAHTNYLCWGWR